ncbi:hypothetical protein K438DRAFT_1993739 [Mycena galopus ATCC 62051]|nr:hypothetical protein K438DRAFT_1993739 [Mycena galopus ATCC 62051]
MTQGDAMKMTIHPYDAMAGGNENENENDRPSLCSEVGGTWWGIEAGAHRETCSPYHEFLAHSGIFGEASSSATAETGPGTKKPTKNLKKTALLRDRKARMKERPLPESPGPSSSRQTDDLELDMQIDMDFIPPGQDADPPPMEGIEEASHPPSPPKSPPSPPQLTASGRVKRSSRLPARFQDDLPQPLEVVPPPEDSLEQPGPTRRVNLIVRDKFQTLANGFGLFRSYLHRPTYDPDSLITLTDLSNRFTPPSPDPLPLDGPTASQSSSSPTRPRSSISLLMEWQNNGNTHKSDGEMNSLVHDVLLHPDFKVEDLKGFHAGRANKTADEAAKAASPLLQDFESTAVDIEVPSGTKDQPAKTFSVPGLHFRKLTTVIKAAFQSPLSAHFHFSPFKLFKAGATPDDEPTRVLSEVYNSDAFIDEHDKIQRTGALPPDDPNCKLEKVVAALMWWSDSTHLANFGTAKLWPIYMLFGNLSKYISAKPNSGAAHHLAYIPSLPDAIQDEISKFHAKWSTQKREILTHCRRELMHAVWKHLLDDEFLHAYKFGIVITCADGIKRRVYPRFFTYSADYPEKVLLATIRDGGICPCPRCLTPKSKLPFMGHLRDLAARADQARKYLGDKVKIARRHIYRSASGIGSAPVELLLKETSSVPTLNAFIERLGDDFQLHQMLVVDFMHEFELGVWKNLFIHLIRLLHAQPDGQRKVNELDRRYRRMPRFSSGTIRRFATNASEMKKLGARDFEDLLKCAIPAFDGLFDEEDNKRVLKLLYRMAEWHAFGKLRMHTEPTLDHLRELTSEIGRLMRQFRDTTCTRWETFELPRETAARNRREVRAAEAAAAGSRPGPSSARTPAANIPVPSPSQKKKKKLNLNTYKWHSMGDYCPTIQLFGPTGCFSTQLGESLHRLVKRLYALSNKRDFEAQIARRVMRLQRARANDAVRGRKKHAHHVGLSQSDPLGETPIEAHHHTSRHRRYPLDIYPFYQQNKSDPAMKEFIPKLQDHLLGRLLKRDFDGDTHDEFTAAQRNSVRISGNRIYPSKTLRVNYTTYDVRRDQDTLNPRLQSFVMVLSPETQPGAHRFWYAQVLGVFNATVHLQSQNLSECTTPALMEFLWVRWLGIEPGYRFGFKRARLPKVGFVPDSDPFAFGFLDPAHVIRGSHLIPDFESGRTSELLGTQADTAARDPGDTDDWLMYYVDIFADRDMVMRYFGGGIGHATFIAPETADDDELDGDGDNLGPEPDTGGGEEDGSDEEEGEGDDSDDSEEEEDEENDDEVDEDFGPEEEEGGLVDDLGFTDF